MHTNPSVANATRQANRNNQTGRWDEEVGIVGAI
jgi:hypothetical protein